MQVTVLYFASLRELVGARREDLELPEPSTVGDLKSTLGQRGARLSLALDSALFSINREFAFPDERLNDGDEIGVFPPVSGGAPRTVLRVTEQQLDLNQLVAEITEPTVGAVGIFTGVVRGRTAGQETAHLEYQAYEAMAVAKLEQVAEEIRQRWPDVQGIAIVQRIGLLEVGTPTVLIACSGAHRDSGVFEAARYGIDRLKQIVPIWKKEIGPAGELWVEGEYQPTSDDRSR
jgi:molybdopterin synthase catalytic subunit